MNDMNEIQAIRDMTPVRGLDEITFEILTLKDQGNRLAMGIVVEIGRRLAEAKAQLPHGEWGKYLRERVNYSQSTAQNYMRAFEEYGAAQIGLFGAEVNSQALGNLGLTQGLKLLALPAEEREDFVREHDVENLSTRELERLIAERDKAAAERDSAAKRAEEAEERLGRTDVRLEALLGERAALTRERDELTRTLEELRDREAAADPEALDEAKRAGAAKERARLEKKLSDVEHELARTRDRAAEEVKKAERAKADAERSLDALNQKFAQERAEFERRLEAVERAARAGGGNEDVAAFKVYFEGTQEQFRLMTECLRRIGESGEIALHDKLRTALRALAEKVLDHLPEELGADEEV